MLHNQCLNELGYEVLPHLPYSSDLSSTDHHFFKHLNNFLQGKCFHNQQKAENAFQEFIESWSSDLYATGINKLISHWQRCVDCDGPILINKDVFGASYNDLKIHSLKPQLCLHQLKIYTSFLLPTWSYHNIVDQLYSSIKLKSFQKTFMPIQSLSLSLSAFFSISILILATVAWKYQANPLNHW